MIFMILTVFSLFVLVGVTIANLVILCAVKGTIKKASAEQATATRKLAGQMGAVLRKLTEDNARDTGADLADDLAKIMSYTGVDHGQ